MLSILTLVLKIWKPKIVKLCLIGLKWGNIWKIGAWERRAAIWKCKMERIREYLIKIWAENKIIVRGPMLSSSYRSYASTLKNRWLLGIESLGGWWQMWLLWHWSTFFSFGWSKGRSQSNTPIGTTKPQRFLITRWDIKSRRPYFWTSETLFINRTVMVFFMASNTT